MLQVRFDFRLIFVFDLNLFSISLFLSPEYKEICESVKVKNMLNQCMLRENGKNAFRSGAARQSSST